MKRALLAFAALLLPTGIAAAKPLALHARLNIRAENRALILTHPAKNGGGDRAGAALDDAVDRAMAAAGLGVSSGKLVLLRSGGREEVALAIRGTRLTPLFDLSLSSAAAVVRMSF
jgi:hypothetical protein